MDHQPRDEVGKNTDPHPRFQHYQKAQKKSVAQNTPRILTRYRAAGAAVKRPCVAFKLYQY
jgi:hypothetical protein